MKRFWKEEDGNILLVFAGSMVLLCFFIGIALDMSLIYLQRNAMQNIAQIMREERFTFRDSVRYADNPAQETSRLVLETAIANNFDGTVIVYFEEEEPQSNFRSYRMRIRLIEPFQFHFGRIFGLNTMDLEVSLDGGESYGEGSSDVVWHPDRDVSSYNGSYTSHGHAMPVFTAGDLPEW